MLKTLHSGAITSLLTLTAAVLATQAEGQQPIASQHYSAQHEPVKHEPVQHYRSQQNGAQHVSSQYQHHSPYVHPQAGRSAPYAGHVNAAHHAPTFRWGWFGAEHFYPTVKWHRGYNGDHYRWSRQRRY